MLYLSASIAIIILMSIFIISMKKLKDLFSAGQAREIKELIHEGNTEAEARAIIAEQWKTIQRSYTKRHRMPFWVAVLFAALILVTMVLNGQI